MIEPIQKAGTDDRRYIALAEGHGTWQQIKASFALEGIELTDENAALAGRVIAGEITLAEAVAELHKANAKRLYD